jgi:ribonucleoside-triphosphate reductase
MGTASVATGSKSVMTINLNRLIQEAVNRYAHSRGENIPKGTAYPLTGNDLQEAYFFIKTDLTNLVERVHKYQAAFNDIIKEFYENDMLDVYSAGFIDMKKQYLTIGVNGLTDAAEFLGIEISDNETYNGFVNLILETINKLNRKNKTRDLMFNTEFVPGENLSKKNYSWDEKDGYFVSKKHNMYSSYFYNPEDKNISILEKMRLHGKRYVERLDGGSALHANLKEHLSKEQYKQLLKVACENGTNYFTFNVKNTRCKDCGHISKHTLDACPHCGGKNLSYLTRIIGYLKEVNSFSEPRQEEEGNRYYE